MARQLQSMQGVPGVEVLINDDSRSEALRCTQRCYDAFSETPLSYIFSVSV
jgi:hypothetical protein